jgi:hypothetical protein
VVLLDLRVSRIHNPHTKHPEAEYCQPILLSKPNKPTKPVQVSKKIILDSEAFSMFINESISLANDSQTSSIGSQNSQINLSRAILTLKNPPCHFLEIKPSQSEHFHPKSVHLIVYMAFTK